jgi:hypothetical protein
MGFQKLKIIHLINDNSYREVNLVLSNLIKTELYRGSSDFRVIGMKTTKFINKKYGIFIIIYLTI